LIVTLDLRSLIRNLDTRQLHLLLLPQHPNQTSLVTTVTRKDTLSFRRKREEQDEKVNVMLMEIEHSLLSKGMNNSFTSNSFIAKSGATCHMRGY
jgi:hypothetical protein